MTDDATKEARDAKAARAARLKAALRDNLRRRKLQARGRAAAAGPEDEARLNEAAVPPEAADPAGRD
jgi:hypothetical protein